MEFLDLISIHGTPAARLGLRTLLNRNRMKSNATHSHARYHAVDTGRLLAVAGPLDLDDVFDHLFDDSMYRLYEREPAIGLEGSAVTSLSAAASC
jgi:hypothetical protein